MRNLMSWIMMAALFAFLPSCMLAQSPVELCSTYLYNNPDPNLVAYYRFEGNVYDSSVGANNGMAFNVPFGSSNNLSGFGQYAIFNGSNGVVVALGSSTPISGSYSVNLWFNTTDVTPGSNLSLFSTRAGNTSPYIGNQYGTDVSINYPSSGFHGDVGSAGGWLTTSANASYTITSGTWYMFTAVYTTTGWTYYVNGNAIGSGSYNGTPIFTSASNELTIGNDDQSSDYWFNGEIDDFAVFSRVLTPTEIAGLYAGTLPSSTTTTVIPSSSSELYSTSLFNDQSLMHYYRLSDTTDSIGGLNLTNNGSASFDPALFGNGWDGGADNTSEWLDAPASYDGPLTISLWVKLSREIYPSVLMYNFAALGNAGTHVSQGIQYYYNGGSPELLFTRQRQDVANDDVAYQIALGTSNWYHLVYTYDGTTVAGYVNGNLVGATSSFGSGSGGPFAALDIGGVGSGNLWRTSTQMLTSGQIDDVAFFSRTLSAIEIAALYAGMLTPSTTTPTVTSVTASCSSSILWDSQTASCTSTVTGTGNPDTSVTWYVNGIQNGNSTVGMFSAGIYTAPSVVPSPPTVTISAVSVFDSTKSGSATITVVPLLTIATTYTWSCGTYYCSGTYPPDGTYYMEDGQASSGLQVLNPYQGNVVSSWTYLGNPDWVEFTISGSNGWPSYNGFSMYICDSAGCPRYSGGSYVWTTTPPLPPSTDSRQAVVSEAFHALGITQDGACNQTVNYEGYNDCVSNWNFLNDQAYPGPQAMNHLVPLFGTDASIWAVSSDGTYYDVTYDTGIPPSFYSDLADYGYSTAGGSNGSVGRGGQCVFFANNILYRSQADTSTLSFATMLNTSGTGRNPDPNLQDVKMGDVLFLYGGSGAFSVNHVAIVVQIYHVNGEVAAVDVIDSNYVPDDMPISAGREVIAKHSFCTVSDGNCPFSNVQMIQGTTQGLYQIWTGTQYYNTTY